MSQQALTHAIDEAAQRSNFSGVVSATGDDLCLQRAYGFADRSNRIANQVTTRFGIASGTRPPSPTCSSTHRGSTTISTRSSYKTWTICASRSRRASSRPLATTFRSSATACMERSGFFGNDAVVNSGTRKDLWTALDEPAWLVVGSDAVREWIVDETAASGK